MDFKDYYATLGVPKTASADEIKRAYRKLARKYHPDVSKERDAEARFKDVAEANEALSDPERRAAYDDLTRRRERGESFESSFGGGFNPGGGRAPGGSGGFGGGDFSDFFESLFGQRGARNGRRPDMPMQGSDHHAKVTIELEDSYRGARRTLGLRVPVADAQGRPVLQERQLDVNIPKGIRQGQHLRLAGQGVPGQGGAAAGDLYLEIELAPHPRFRVDGRDVFFDLPMAPWEAALGGTLTAPTPEGDVQLNVPAGSSSGRRLRLKGRGLPGNPAGDLYAVLQLALPPTDDTAQKEAWQTLAKAFAGWNPRSGTNGTNATKG